MKTYAEKLEAVHAVFKGRTSTLLNIKRQTLYYYRHGLDIPENVQKEIEKLYEISQKMSVNKPEKGGKKDGKGN